MPKKTSSQQPRFSDQDVESTFLAMMDWADAIEQAPEYQPDTRIRDSWLSDFWKQESHFQGVIHSMVSIDANRGWTLTGGRNQTLRYTTSLHDWIVAAGLYGWRPGVVSMATSFYVTDFGGIAEIGRDGKNGPTRQFFHLDPTKCMLTGLLDTPVKYYPKVGKSKKAIPFRELDFVRVTSMPDIKEEFRGAGYCFTSRALLLVQLMVAIWRHDLEDLGAAAPKGLLLLTGISEKQWQTAMEVRKAERKGEGWSFYRAIQVLANPHSTIDAKIIALSNLPTGLDQATFVGMYMYGLALCAGYDPSEFYPVQFGSLGRGTEMEVQHEKATGKGGRNFALALQEQFQRPDILPETLHFEFDERDEAAEVEAANVAKAWIDTYRSARETGLQTDGLGGISNYEFRYLLAEKNIIPAEWAQEEVPETMTDEDEEGIEESRSQRITRDLLLSKPHIWRTISAFPKEPLVEYSWPRNRIKTLWSSGADLLHRRSHPVRKIKRQADESEVLYKSGDIVITEDIVKGAIETGKKRVGDEFASLLDNEPITPEEEGA